MTAPSPSAPPPVVNDVLLLARVGGNARLAVDLLRGFSADDGAILQRIDTSLGDGDIASAYQHLHQLAGTAGNLALERLAAAAKRAENALCEALKSASPTTSPHLSEVDLDTVERCLFEALVGCRLTAMRFEASPAPDARPADAITGTAVERLRLRLGGEIRDCRLEALDTMDELAPHLGADAKDLRDALARLDFTAAAGILESLPTTE